MAINLILDEDQEQKKATTEGRKFYISIITIGMLTFLGVMITIGIQYGMSYIKISALDAEKINLSNQEKQYQDFSNSYQKYVNHKARTLLADHPYFSQLVEYFNASVTPNVTITRSSFFTDSSATVEGFSTVGLRPFSVFENNLVKRGFTNLKVLSTSMEEGTNNLYFNITFNYDLKKLKK